jgi:hypothetical protein
MPYGLMMPLQRFDRRERLSEATLDLLVPSAAAAAWCRRITLQCNVHRDLRSDALAE